MGKSQLFLACEDTERGAFGGNGHFLLPCPREGRAPPTLCPPPAPPPSPPNCPHTQLPSAGAQCPGRAAAGAGEPAVAARGREAAEEGRAGGQAGGYPVPLPVACGRQQSGRSSAAGPGPRPSRTQGGLGPRLFRRAHPPCPLPALSCSPRTPGRQRESPPLARWVSQMHRAGALPPAGPSPCPQATLGEGHSYLRSRFRGGPVSVQGLWLEQGGYSFPPLTEPLLRVRTCRTLVCGVSDLRGDREQGCRLRRTRENTRVHLNFE